MRRHGRAGVWAFRAILRERLLYVSVGDLDDQSRFMALREVTRRFSRRQFPPDRICHTCDPCNAAWLQAPLSADAAGLVTSSINPSKCRERMSSTWWMSAHLRRHR